MHKSMATAISSLHMEKYQQDPGGVLLEDSIEPSSCSLSSFQSPKPGRPNLKSTVVACPPSSAEQRQRTP